MPDSIRQSVIDDVALARAVKTGGRIFLGHSAQARSIRPYPGFPDLWRMIARSAYAQLRFSPLVLAGTVLGMALSAVCSNVVEGSRRFGVFRM